MAAVSYDEMLSKLFCFDVAKLKVLEEKFFGESKVEFKSARKTEHFSENTLICLTALQLITVSALKYFLQLMTL